jgi:hypothetical protein
MVKGIVASYCSHCSNPDQICFTDFSIFMRRPAQARRYRAGFLLPALTVYFFLQPGPFELALGAMKLTGRNPPANPGL